MKPSPGYLLQVIAAVIAVGGLLHALNRSLSSLLINAFPSLVGYVVYVALAVLELTCLLSIILAGKLLFRPNSMDAKKLGLWLEEDETVIDIRSATASENTMNVTYGIRRRTVNNLRFWSGSGPSESERQAPEISVSGLPDGTSYNADFVTSGNRRYYNMHFSPPLKAGFRPLKPKVSIRELTRGQYYACQEDIPNDSRDEFSLEGFDHVSERIGLYTKRLILQVIFPPGFVPIAKSYIGVRIGFSETPLRDEERRLADVAVLSPGHNDRRQLVARINRPVLGATYFLLWKPPFAKAE